MQLDQSHVDHNLCARLAAVAAARAGAPAVVFPEYGPDGVVSYARLVDLVAGAAGTLRARGVGPGDRVMVGLDNRPEFLVVVLACASLGATAVVVNHRLGRAELEVLVTASGASCVVTSRAFGEAWGDLLGRVGRAIFVQRGGAPGPEGGGHGAHACDLFAPADSRAEPVAVRGVDPAFVFYTSGTTAVPKGVVVTHAHARWAAEHNAANLAVGQADVTLLFAPLHHVMGFSYQMLTTLFSGGCVVLRKAFNPARFWGDAVEHRCTWTAVMPYVCHALEAFPVPESHYFQFWGYGSKNLDVEARFRVDTVGWWGMTELFAIGSVSQRNEPTVPNYSVGRAARGYELRLADAREDAGPFRASINGGLEVRGERGVTMFLEYLGEPADTAAAFTPDGWFITGDRFFEDSRQTLFFDVRTKDILRVGGENVSAAEIEFAAYGSGVVKEIAVVAAPHKTLGEVPIVCAILTAQAEGDRARAEAEILRACRERLAEFKRPQAVVFVDEFPRAELGKVAKNRLRELLAGQRIEVDRRRAT